MIRRPSCVHSRPSIGEQFGIRGAKQVLTDTRTISRHVFRRGRRPGLSVSTLGLFRPDLSLPAYAGFLPEDGLSPIFNLFDRALGGRGFRYTVTRDHCRDFRGGRLSYDEHDGTDLVCPPGMPLVAAAPGVVVAIRDIFYRGGLTAIVDHGGGIVTQYSHLSRVLADVGQPVERGEPVGLSGTSGIDMLAGFPWVPPHIHFMVWVNGRPVDPFVAGGEPPRPGSWLHGNMPRTSGPIPGDRIPARLVVDEAALCEAMAACLDQRVREELEAAPTAAARAAICEDSMHHDRGAWPSFTPAMKLRPREPLATVRLTLPLPDSEYTGARFADAPWTRPAA